MKLTFLGTGTSTGVPQIGCDCPTCHSTDPRDKRFRSSALLQLDSGTNILIDCGPDFRSQILRIDSPALDALLVTHSHYDHVGGIDDLRPYCAGKDFPVWCRKDVADDLRSRNPWSFAEHLYPGVPTFDLNIIEPFKPFTIDRVRITPLEIMHAKLPILGFRFDNLDGGNSLAYVTDCKTMPRKTIDEIKGIDTLVLNALRFSEHISHLTVAEALEIVDKVKPGRTYFTHICHQMGCHADVKLPDNVFLAYDGLTVKV